jgi:leucyl/phenylalanyl-tRNA--protein transferase
MNAYAQGYFPMGRSRHAADIDWYDPDPRGILPLEAFHIPRRMVRMLRRSIFTFTVDQAFPQVIEECARARGDRATSWINDTILTAYIALHKMGHAHSVEVWAEERLVGGLYGVSLGGAFFGESMFSRMPEASKQALVILVDLLTEAGGPTGDAMQDRIVVVQLSGHRKQARVFSLIDFVKTGDIERVPLVRGGDLVYVPRIGDNTWKKALDEFRETTSLFSILALVRALGL